MHALLALVIGTSAMGVNVGWQPLRDGGLEYIIQIEPEQLANLKPGDSLSADIRPALEDVRRYRIVIGTGPLPHIGEPDRSAPRAPGLIGPSAAAVGPSFPAVVKSDVQSQPPTRAAAALPLARLSPSDWATGTIPVVQDNLSGERVKLPAGAPFGPPAPPPAASLDPGSVSVLVGPHREQAASPSPIKPAWVPVSPPPAAPLVAIKSVATTPATNSNDLPPATPSAKSLPIVKQDAVKQDALAKSPAAPAGTVDRYADRYADRHADRYSDRKADAAQPAKSPPVVTADSSKSDSKLMKLMFDERLASQAKVETPKLQPLPPPTKPGTLTFDPAVRPVSAESDPWKRQAATAAANLKSSAQEPSPAANSGRPWMALTVTLFFLFASLGGNVFLGWVTYEARRRYRLFTEQVRGGVA